MKAGYLTYSRRGRFVRRLMALLLGYGYIPRLRWSLRILGWFVTAGLFRLAGWRYAVLGPVAFEVLLRIWISSETRRNRKLPGPVPLDPLSPLAQALRQEALRQDALPRVPSPGGWTVPRDVLPAWNWTPPPGIEPRWERVPRWVRTWYKTPLVDRYAHAWMWHHGGWDVIRPEAWTE